MARGLHGAYELREAAGANLNQAANTVLLSFYLPGGGGVRRFGLVSEAAAGILAPTVLKLSYSVDGGANYTDVTNETLTPGARSRGVPVYKNVETSTSMAIPANALVAVRVSTDAGGASTARVWAEVENNVYAGSNIPTTAIAVTG